MQAHVLCPHLACCSAGTFRCASMAGAVMPCWLVRSSCRRPSRDSSAGASAPPAQHSHRDRVAHLRGQWCTSSAHGFRTAGCACKCTSLGFEMRWAVECTAGVQWSVQLHSVRGAVECAAALSQGCSGVCSCPRAGCACRCTQPRGNANLPGNAPPTCTTLRIFHVANCHHVIWSGPTSFKGSPTRPLPTRQLQSYQAHSAGPDSTLCLNRGRAGLLFSG